MAAAGKIQFFLSLAAVAVPFTEQPHTPRRRKAENATEFAAKSHYLCTAIFTEPNNSAPLLSVCADRPKT